MRVCLSKQAECQLDTKSSFYLKSGCSVKVFLAKNAKKAYKKCVFLTLICIKYSNFLVCQDSVLYTMFICII